MNEEQRLRARVFQLTEFIRKYAISMHMSHHTRSQSFASCQRPACVNVRNLLGPEPDAPQAEPQGTTPGPGIKPAVLRLHSNGMAEVIPFDTMAAAKAAIPEMRQEGWPFVWPVTLNGDGTE